MSVCVSQSRPRSRNMRKTALRRMQSVQTVGTTISVTISMWPIKGSETQKIKSNTSIKIPPL